MSIFCSSLVKKITHNHIFLKFNIAVFLILHFIYCTCIFLGFSLPYFILAVQRETGSQEKREGNIMTAWNQCRTKVSFYSSICWVYRPFDIGHFRDSKIKAVYIYIYIYIYIYLKMVKPLLPLYNVILSSIWVVLDYKKIIDGERERERERKEKFQIRRHQFYECFFSVKLHKTAWETTILLQLP